MIELGLVRYVSQTGDADRLTVDFRAPDRDPAAAPSEVEEDPWDSWVFRLSVDAGFEGESQQSETRLFGSVNANRTTEALQIQIQGFAFYEENQFDFEDKESFASIARFAELSGQ